MTNVKDQVSLNEDMKNRIIEAAHKAISRSREDSDCVDRTEVETEVLLGLLKIINTQKNSDEWISIKDHLPPSGKHVLAKTDKYECVAFYAERFSVSVGYYSDYDIDCEYNEDMDEYFLAEGWYEVVHNWEEYSSVTIEDEVIGWMDLPKRDRRSKYDYLGLLD